VNIHSVEQSANKMRSARSLGSDRPVIADKREAILRAAIRVFAHNGYFNSKVADIAREAGVADGTVYLYFKSKEEILHSVFDRNMEEAIAAGRQQLEQLSDAREKLKELVAKALVIPKTRKPTKPTGAAVERRLDEKRRRGTTKRLRRSVDD